MKFTFSWLKTFLETDKTIDVIADKLTMLGLEVEKIIDRSNELKDFIVVEIVETLPHPNADKLKICIVNDGIRNIQIVCGAENARKNLKTVLAPIGSVIPANGMNIKLSKIRDIESNGMLCSFSELNINSNESGIIELKNDVKIGDAFYKIYGLDDPVIELSITPNRGDCLGVYGIARELSAAGIGSLKKIENDSVNIENNKSFTIDLKTKLCDAYHLIYFENIDNQDTYKFTNRLKAIGVHSHSPIVDFGNYISYSYNRPVHIFDADKISGNHIEVREATKGEKFRALTNIEYSLNGSEIVVSDKDKIIALAGIIGSENSACDISTKNILIEIALFDDISISKTGRSLSIESDARYRFERKLDPLFIDKSISLITDEISKNFKPIKYYHNFVIQKPYQPIIIDFNLDKFYDIVGFKIDMDFAIKTLNDLGFIVKRCDDYLNLTVASWRNDISIEEDIVEELLRIYGYDNIVLQPIEKTIVETLSPLDAKMIEIRRMLASNGFDEIISWSFISDKKAKLFSDIKEELLILNPINIDQNYMRPTVIPNMLDIIKKNNSRQFNNLSFFEIGNNFKGTNIDDQILTISAIRSGNISQKNIYNDNRSYDIYDIKSDFISIMTELGISFNKITLDTANIPDYLHPYRSAICKIGKLSIGYFGQLSEMIKKQWDIKNDLFILEIYPELLSFGKSTRSVYKISEYQSSNRDFAFIFDKNQRSDEIVRLIKSVDSKLIQDVKLFDVYEIDENSKSLAYNVKIQSFEKTLNENEINDICKKIEDIIGLKLKGILRSIN